MSKKELNTAVDHVNESIDIAGIGASFMNDNIHPMISALVELSDCNGMSDHAINIRMSLIQDLAKLGRHLVEEAAGHMESLQGDMEIKLKELQGSAA